MITRLLLLCMLALGINSYAQKMPVSYDFGEKFTDRYRYSNLVTIDNDGDGGYILVRAYFQGLILKPKGYFIEHYNKDLELVSEYNYKLKGMQFVDGFTKNGQLNLIFLNYDFETGFIISTHHIKGKTNQHTIHLFDTNLNKKWEHDFSAEVEEKNYGFEQVAFSNNLEETYIIGKAYFKKKRFQVDERKFQYELIKISGGISNTQSFDDPGKFSEGLYPIVKGNELLCVGFYADRKDNRYNGVSYFNINPYSLAIKSKKYHPFSQQFMEDKFGRDEDKVVKNLVFKSVAITKEDAILFNAEEYFVTNSLQVTGAGQRMKVERFHHNDIVSAKLDSNGDLLWTRNINKAEVTQGDGAYASYSSYNKDGNTYFFICTSSENPQLINGERLIFKQGLSRNRNVFLISLDKSGVLDYEKVIGDEEARLPLMVSKPLIDTVEDQLLFYAKRGNKKQLVEVVFE